MKSEIRPTEIDALFERVQKKKYKRYLNRIKLVRLRGFRDAEITFDFPVTALVGPNGSGKTTVLGAAALIYESVKPRRFFAKSGKYDDSMQDWRVEYELLDREQQANASLSRTASYLRAKWNRDAVQRKVVVFGVARTLPASERKELARCISGDFQGVSEVAFEATVVNAVENILGKEAANYLRVDADRAGRVSIYAARGATAENTYSEFHFGAGEASVIRIVAQIETADEQSLILIEEIENGLHPVATRRLVEYLIDVARRKSCQVIFTTHSNDAIAPLPTNAVWATYAGKVAQGKLDVTALRTLTGQVEARLALFTEDRFSELVADVTLRSYGQQTGLKVDRSGIEIHSLEGASQARNHTRYHNSNPTKKFHAVAMLDGDKRTESGYEPKPVPGYPVDAKVSDTVFNPGESSPENHIFQRILENLDSNSTLVAKLTLALTLDTSVQQSVRDSIESRAFTNRDRHLIFAQIGEDLGFLSESVVQRAFVVTWANAFPEDVAEIWDPCRDLIPTIDSNQGSD